MRKAGVGPLLVGGGGILCICLHLQQHNNDDVGSPPHFEKTMKLFQFLASSSSSTGSTAIAVAATIITTTTTCTVTTRKIRGIGQQQYEQE